MKLAIHGGTPVRDAQQNPWPRWLISTEEDEVLEAIIRIQDNAEELRKK